MKLRLVGDNITSGGDFGSAISFRASLNAPRETSRHDTVCGCVVAVRGVEEAS